MHKNVISLSMSSFGLGLWLGRVIGDELQSSDACLWSGLEKIDESDEIGERNLTSDGRAVVR